ncbi:hypothetical protein V9T40_003775 [Parthenolecanium corni]|uniref:Uncharacterized protein n=1 Tax=Parthenolecanium corni TaxID=536013 RepID=A0AAN9TTD5_9HEMI
MATVLMAAADIDAAATFLSHDRNNIIRKRTVGGYSNDEGCSHSRIARTLDQLEENNNLLRSLQQRRQDRPSPSSPVTLVGRPPPPPPPAIGRVERF